MAYAKHMQSKQTEKAKPTQVKNNAGGYVFALDKWKTLERFLILGTQDGSYYATERDMTRENATFVVACAEEDIVRTLNTIVEMRNRAPKPSPAIFALALLSNYELGDAVNKVCLTGTQLFEFVEACNQLRGWGSRLKKIVANWYTAKSKKTLGYQVTKYAQRNGWSHRDVLRLCHAKSNDLQEVFQYVCQKDSWSNREDKDKYLSAVEDAKTCSLDRTVKLIRENGLPRECIQTEYLNKPAVWEALLEDMGMTALLRNLNKMSAIGMTTPMSSTVMSICNKLSHDNVQKAGVHPLTYMNALLTYKQGRGNLGSLTWKPDQTIVSHLESAFYDAFKAIKPTGKRFYLALDVSASMTWDTIANSQLTPRDASAIMAMSTMRAEQWHYIKGFSHNMVDININKGMALDACIKTIQKVQPGSTNCSLPMQDALLRKIPVDTFVVYTDNETYQGGVHPYKALQNYRQGMGINAKLIVCGMTATQFTIADPSDPGMLDVVGFDTNCPSIISEFSL